MIHGKDWILFAEASCSFCTFRLGTVASNPRSWRKKIVPVTISPGHSLNKAKPFLSILTLDVDNPLFVRKKNCQEHTDKPSESDNREIGSIPQLPTTYGIGTPWPYDSVDAEIYVRLLTRSNKSSSWVKTSKYRLDIDSGHWFRRSRNLSQIFIWFGACRQDQYVAFSYLDLPAFEVNWRIMSVLTMVLRTLHTYSGVQTQTHVPDRPMKPPRPVPVKKRSLSVTSIPTLQY